MDKKTPRKDKLKNISKAAPLYLKNPLKTEREIAKEAGIGVGTAHRVKQELEQSGAKSEFVLEVLEKDKSIIRRGLEIIQEKLNDDEQVKSMRVSEVSNVIKENTARYTLFAGSLTDDDGGMKEGTILDISNIGDLVRAFNQKIGKK